MKKSFKLYLALLVAFFLNFSAIAFDEIKILRGGEDYGRDRIKSIITTVISKRYGPTIQGQSIEIFQDQLSSRDRYDFLIRETSESQQNKLLIFRKDSAKFVKIYLARPFEVKVFKGDFVSFVSIDKCQLLRNISFYLNEYYGVIYL